MGAFLYVRLLQRPTAASGAASCSSGSDQVGDAVDNGVRSGLTDPERQFEISGVQAVSERGIYVFEVPGLGQAC